MVSIRKFVEIFSYYFQFEEKKISQLGNWILISNEDSHKLYKTKTNLNLGSRCQSL